MGSLGWEADVQLSDLGALDAAIVLDVGLDADNLLEEVLLATGDEGAGRVGGVGGGLVGDLCVDLAVGEGGVAEAVAEGVADGHVLGVEVAVVDEDALCEVAVLGVAKGDGVVVGVLGDGVG